MVRLPGKTLLAVALALSACGGSSPRPTSVSGLVFLTSDGCSNSQTMRLRLEEALRRLRVPSDYQVINVASLPAIDARRSYQTPTLLYAGQDIFGIREAPPPYPEPT
jgi:hypothetical protein